ncbi:hypothetical protein Q1695_006156 [Nippostrongylus brasiliensis]|nr:hypothetical protein Q1695_006156 [Nippostrongylus brasiliensis]
MNFRSEPLEVFEYFEELVRTYAQEDFTKDDLILIDGDIEQSLLICDALALLNRVNIANFSSIYEGDFPGFTGPITIDSDGSRLPYFRAFTWESDNLQLSVTISPRAQPCDETNSSCVTYIVRFEAESVVLLQLRTQERSCPSCKFRMALVAVVIICGLIGVPLLAAFQFHRRERQIHKMTWRVDYESITRSNRVTKEDSVPGLRRVSSANSVGISSLVAACQSPDSSIAYVNNTKVYVKKYQQRRAINFSRSDMMHLDQLHKLSHTNVNAFVGICFNQSRELMTLWTYCARSSLDYIIFEKGRQFGRTFQSAFLKNIIKGLQYIHNSPMKFHGSLYLSNCVVDTNWVVKLTDFGLHDIIWDRMLTKELACSQSVDPDYMPLKYLELPPEMLRNVIQESALGKGSTKADVYQLGMLLYQILFHARPFADRTTMTIKSIAKKICEVLDADEDPFQPNVPENDYGLRLISIMKQCWSLTAGVRPDLNTIADAVAREFETEGRGNVIDQMIRVIDDYSDNLEAMVSKRTKYLEDSLHRTESLLFHIMPRRVAENLREELPIKPEMHTNVSVLVTDISKYTELCETTIPIHVINILQDLYSSFDKIVSEHDAFKVENVGDCYMLVSGLDDCPYHLREVCRISLEFLDFVETFEVKHNTKYKLRIKVGFHSGAVASGILGSSAPRFCIFGDTVNMANRMANLSEPGRVQMTESVAQTVKAKYPGFIVEERGFVNLKGKGPVFTCWLTGCIGSRATPRATA